MKLYLSSYKIGDDPQKLKNLLPENCKAIYISNALDFARPQSQKKHEDWDLGELEQLGIESEHLDLRDYFGQ